MKKIIKNKFLLALVITFVILLIFIFVDFNYLLNFGTEQDVSLNNNFDQDVQCIDCVSNYSSRGFPFPIYLSYEGGITGGESVFSVVNLVLDFVIIYLIVIILLIIYNRYLKAK